MNILYRGKNLTLEEKLEELKENGEVVIDLKSL